MTVQFATIPVVHHFTELPGLIQQMVVYLHLADKSPG
jgi:hypothetical protein